MTQIANTPRTVVVLRVMPDFDDAGVGLQIRSFIPPQRCRTMGYGDRNSGWQMTLKSWWARLSRVSARRGEDANVRRNNHESHVSGHHT